MTRDARASLRGLKAKRAGDFFENLFAMNCQRVGVTVTSIPDGCIVMRPLPGQRIPRLKRCKTPFDYLITHECKASALDCKTVQSGNFGCSQVDPDQLRELSNVTIPSGYVVYFRDADRVQFMPVEKLKSLKRGQSLSSEDGIHLGSGSSFDVRNIWT